jgi:CheY-like chemotaxis protein
MSKLTGLVNWATVVSFQASGDRMKTILVIGDKAQTRDIFVRSLEFEGFHAFNAESGSVGVKLAQTYLPNLIVCDIMMPCTSLRKETR